MDQTSALGIIILFITGLFTYKGFQENAFFRRYCFEVDGILVKKENNRLITSGLLHLNWIHFGFNMIAMLSFAQSLEGLLGYGKVLAIYVVSLLGGNFLALYIHRQHGDYSAAGASGAVSGLVFSSIVLFPNGSISFILLPFELTNWVIGILFVVVSIFGIKSKKGNIGHEAHLGGALVGLLLTIAFQPSILETNWWIIALLAVPTIAFLILIVRNPAVLMIDQYWGESVRNAQRGLRGSSSPKISPNQEMDQLLDKIRKKGIKSLSTQERKRLNELRDQLN